MVSDDDSVKNDSDECLDDHDLDEMAEEQPIHWDDEMSCQDDELVHDDEISEVNSDNCDFEMRNDIENNIVSAVEDDEYDSEVHKDTFT